MTTDDEMEAFHRMNRLCVTANRAGHAEGHAEGFREGHVLGRLALLKQVVDAYRLCTPSEFEDFMRRLCADSLAKAEEHIAQ